MNTEINIKKITIWILLLILYYSGLFFYGFSFTGTSNHELFYYFIGILVFSIPITMLAISKRRISKKFIIFYVIWLIFGSFGSIIISIFSYAKNIANTIFIFLNGILKIYVFFEVLYFILQIPILVLIIVIRQSRTKCQETQNQVKND
jgi:hypothetical protein